MESLTPAEAAELAGVPAAQLVRWAWEDWDAYERRPSCTVGPRNVGTRHKPMWRRDDVLKWRARYAHGGLDTKSSAGAREA